jgi:Protein of unknown function (DUF3662)/Inner membrane component of T3SS, cytoplasmic domain
MGLKRFEGRLERLVGSATGRGAGGRLQPIEIGRRLTREMDLQRRVGARGSLVAPNAFVVSLSPTDVERFSSYLDALVRELAEAARQHAEIERYELLGPVEVDVFESTRIRTGGVEVEARVVEGEWPAELVLPDGRRFPIGERPLIIGRLPELDVVLEDSNVSRRPAEVVRQGRDLVVRDLRSTNGTKLNGQPVSVSTLKDGDQIIVGATRIVVEVP